MREKKTKSISEREIVKNTYKSISVIYFGSIENYHLIWPRKIRNASLSLFFKIFKGDISNVRFG